jgi:hypothetical protein
MQTPIVDCDFAGGNILCDGIDADVVSLRQDQRDTVAYTWFYWYFRVRGASGRRLKFVFEDNVVGVRGPGLSLDSGHAWRWLGAESADERSFLYTFPEDAGEVRFSFGMPYTQADLDASLVHRQSHPHLRAGTLCQSRKGRRVESLTFGRLDGRAEHRVLLTARHHCCEMMASYALDGVIDAVLAEDAVGEWLRHHVEFMALPFVDKDGVEEGDQGKGRHPHDHNRDYAAPCLYPEVAAIREFGSRWAGDRLRFALDLHCPGQRGEWHELIHFVGIPEAGKWARTEQFCEALENSVRGPLPYRKENNLPFGVDWNIPEEYGDLSGEPRSAGRWLGNLTDVAFGACIEIPYANAQGAEVNADTSRAFGRDLAAAIRLYLD